MGMGKTWLCAIPKDDLIEILRTGSLSGLSLVSASTINYLSEIKERWSKTENKRLFIAYDHGIWLGVDNSSGEFFVEEFSDWRAAIAWLNDPTLDPEVAEETFSLKGARA